MRVRACVTTSTTRDRRPADPFGRASLPALALVVMAPRAVAIAARVARAHAEPDGPCQRQQSDTEDPRGDPSPENRELQTTSLPTDDGSRALHPQFACARPASFPQWGEPEDGAGRRVRRDGSIQLGGRRIPLECRGAGGVRQ